MKLLLTLMSMFAIACKASTQQGLRLDDSDMSALSDLQEAGLSTSSGATFGDVDSYVGRAELLGISNELADARSELEFQSNVIKDMVAQVNELDAEYKNGLPNQQRSRMPHRRGNKQHKPVPTVDSHSSAHAKDKTTKRYSARKATDTKTAELLESEQASDDEDEGEDEQRFSDNAAPPIMNPLNQNSLKFNFLRIVLQLIVGVFYFYMIVQHYPRLTPNGQAPPEAIRLQKLNPFAAAMEASSKILFCSFCCPGPRAAHTFEITGIFSYWFGLIVGSCFPCCTLLWTNTATDLNVRLGGEQMGFIPGCLSAFFCSCCLIAQDAESLDLLMGVRTGLYGMETPQDRMVQAVAGAAAGQALHHMV